MPYVDQPATNQDFYKSILIGDTPLRIGGGGGIETGGSVGTAAPDPASSPQSSGTAGSIYNPQSPMPVSGTNMAELTQGIHQGVGDFSGNLQDIGAQFRELAGPSRTFESIGGSDVLDRAIRPSTPDSDRASAFDAASGLLGARYDGPSGLGDVADGGLGRQLEDLGALSRGLGTGQGYQSILRAANPGLTPGEARYDATRAFGDTSWRAPVQGVERAVDTAQKTYETAEQEAQDYAKQRGAEEKDIATSGRDYLKGAQESLFGSLNQRMDAGRDQNQQIAENFANLQKGSMTGSEAWSQGYAPGYADPTGKTVNPFLEKQKEGAEKFNAVWDKFGQIGDIPLLGAGTTFNPDQARPYGGGPLGIGLSPYTTTLPDGTQRGLTPQEQYLVQARQEALKPLFATASRDPQTGVYNYEDRGGYADVLPLTFGTPYQEGNIAPFLSLDPGSGVQSVAQFATEGERYTMDQIDSLLGQVKSLGDASPFEAASIAADIGQYLRSEEQRLTQSGNEADEEAAKYLRGVKAKTQDLRKWLNRNPQVGSVATVLEGV